MSAQNSSTLNSRFCIRVECVQSFGIVKKQFIEVSETKLNIVGEDDGM